MCLVTISLYPVLFWRALTAFFRKLISFHPSLKDGFRTCVTLNMQAFKTKLLSEQEGRGELPLPTEPKSSKPKPIFHSLTHPPEQSGFPFSSTATLSEKILGNNKARLNSYVRQILRRICSANISFEKSKKFAMDINRRVLRYSNMDGC